MRGTEFAEMSAFAAIAQQRSFTKAAIQLGVSRSTLSQNLRALEERLGVRLLNRTTRSVTLTEAGLRFVNRVQAALGDLTAAVDEVNHYRQSPIGLLRIAVQPPVASYLIGPIMARFMSEFPGINLDVEVVKMPADIVSGGFDAGIRFGEQVDQDMIAIPVMGEAQVSCRRGSRLSCASSTAQDATRLEGPRLHSQPIAERRDLWLGIRKER